jgi:hypothetical protein
LSRPEYILEHDELYGICALKFANYVKIYAWESVPRVVCLRIDVCPREPLARGPADHPNAIAEGKFCLDTVKDTFGLKLR